MGDLLKLSVATQFALGTGYIAYCLAYLGNRSHHQTIDVTLSTLGFGLIATFILQPSPLPWFWHFDHPWLEMVAFAVTIVCGLAWRGFGRKLLGWALRAANISWKDDAPSPLDALHQDTSVFMTQVSVQLKDGTWLRCDNAHQYRDAPLGPCVIGRDGSIGLYLTHVEKEDGTVRELKTVRFEGAGDRMTYVPASEVKMINLRHKQER